MAMPSTSASPPQGTLPEENEGLREDLEQGFDQDNAAMETLPIPLQPLQSQDLVQQAWDQAVFADNPPESPASESRKRKHSEIEEEDDDDRLTSLSGNLLRKSNSVVDRKKNLRQVLTNQLAAGKKKLMAVLLHICKRARLDLPEEEDSSGGILETENTQSVPVDNGGYAQSPTAPELPSPGYVLEFASHPGTYTTPLANEDSAFLADLTPSAGGDGTLNSAQEKARYNESITLYRLKKCLLEIYKQGEDLDEQRLQLRAETLKVDRETYRYSIEPKDEPSTSIKGL